MATETDVERDARLNVMLDELRPPLPGEAHESVQLMRVGPERFTDANAKRLHELMRERRLC